MKAKVSEAVIRDKLAESLELLEPGLELISLEFPLPNAIGTRGYIDILARDKFNNLVIIELKRSDQAARQAIHELHKYVALLRMKEGLSHGTIRTLLVSTDWSELRVPFAEFKSSSDYQCDGFELHINDDGSIVKAILHQPASVESDIRFFSVYSVFLFENPSRLDSALSEIQKAFDRIGGSGAVSLIMTYTGGNPGVIYPHAVYFVPTSVSNSLWDALKRQAYEEGDLTEDDDERHVVEQSVLGSHMQELGLVWDSYEIGYPEKFAGLKELGWKTSSVIRNGQVPSVAAMDDNEIAMRIAGIDQDNSISFLRSSTPRLLLHWREIKSNICRSLTGNPTWQEAANWFFSHVESSLPNSTVSIAVYNPQNLPRTIYELVSIRDARFVPSFEMIAVDPGTTSAITMVSEICWNGRIPNGSEKLIRKQAERYMCEAHFGEQAGHDQKLMQWLGLSYRVFIIMGTTSNIEETSELLLGQEDGLPTSITSLSEHQTFADFLNSNHEFVSALVQWMSTNTITC